MPPKFVLPPCQLFLIAYDFLCGQSFICRQRNKSKVHMRGLFIHMHDSRHDRLGRLMCLNKFESILEIFFDISSLLALEELGACGDKCFDKPNAVLSGLATRFGNLLLSDCSIFALWLNQVKVVLAARSVHIGIARVFFFCAFVMRFDVAISGPLYFANLKIPYCAFCIKPPKNYFCLLMKYFCCIAICLRYAAHFSFPFQPPHFGSMNSRP